MRGRKISREELRRQIEEEGADWGITPYDTIFGDVIAGEEVLTVLPLAKGVNIIEEVSRDICSVDQSYPMGSVIRSRLKKHERTVAHRNEIKHMAVQAGINSTMEAINHEVAREMRELDKGRIVVPARSHK